MRGEEKGRRGEEQGRREREKRRGEVKVKRRRGEGAGGGKYSLISDGVTDGN